MMSSKTSWKYSRLVGSSKIDSGQREAYSLSLPVRFYLDLLQRRVIKQISIDAYLTSLILSQNLDFIFEFTSHWLNKE